MLQRLILIDCVSVCVSQLNGFVERHIEAGGVEGPPQMSSPLMLIESFLEALTNCDKDGRIVLTKSSMRIHV